jgi:hypothetical protein
MKERIQYTFVSRNAATSLVVVELWTDFFQTIPIHSNSNQRNNKARTQLVSYMWRDNNVMVAKLPGMRLSLHLSLLLQPNGIQRLLEAAQALIICRPGIPMSVYIFSTQW